MAIATLIGAGCSPTPTLPPVPTPDPMAVCQGDVEIANRSVGNVEALDFAIEDCGSLATLKAAMGAAPGYLPAGVSVESFVATRCTSSTSADVIDSPICHEVTGR
jgi:hypothetical protein